MLENVSFTIYKLFCKIVNYRIMNIIEPLICPTQNGFINGRHLQLNSAVVEKILEKMQQVNDDDQLINLYDFEKAFDSVSHESIIRIFEHLNTPSLLLRIITSIYSNVKV